ncbi:hypothetical protein BASA83_007003 [Batrachochytrium salamandrivorans]|nr:hypothetical protein BASA83_007003 [Batrachochytrium salamandrivorans]
MSFGGYGGYNGNNNAGNQAGNGYHQQGGTGYSQHQQQYQSGGGGGGFMASGNQYNGNSMNNSNSNSPMADSPNNKKKGTQNQSLRPVTIKQLLAATQHQQTPESPFVIDGQELTQVTIVGRLNSVTIQSTNCTYVVDDGTGASVECKKFFDHNSSDDEPQAAAQFVEGSYVRVFGQIKAFASKKTLGVFKMRPVTSVDEITYHNTEAILAHLALTRGLAPPIAGGNMGGQYGGMMAGAGSQGMQQGHSRQYQQQQQQQYGQYGQGGMDNNNTSYGQGNDSMFTPIQNQILNFAREHQNSVEGMSVPNLIFRMRGQAAESQIRDEIQYLANEGHIYSTLDEEHYKSTGGN